MNSDGQHDRLFCPLVKHHRGFYVTWTICYIFYILAIYLSDSLANNEVGHVNLLILVLKNMTFENKKHAKKKDLVIYKVAKQRFYS